MNKHTSDGYVLGWVLIVMLAMMMLGILALSVAAKNHQIALDEQWNHQAYHTARSMAELAAAAMEGETEDSALLDAVTNRLSEGKYEFELQVEGLSPDMGESRLGFYYEEEEGELTILSHGQYNGKMSRVFVKLSEVTDGESRWFYIMSYGDGTIEEEGE